MFGANVKSAHHAADVSQVSLTIRLQCVLFQIHNSQFFVVWQRRVSKEVYGILLHFLEEEERSHTCYLTTTCFKHALPDYNLNMAIMNKSKEREKPRWTRQIQPVASACISVHLYFIVMMPYQIVYIRNLLYSIKHFNSDSHHVNISLEVSFHFVTKVVRKTNMAAEQTTVHNNNNEQAVGKCLVGIYLRSPLFFLFDLK